MPWVLPENPLVCHKRIDENKDKRRDENRSDELRRRPLIPPILHHDAQRRTSAAEERRDEGTASKRSALAAVCCKCLLERTVLIRDVHLLIQSGALFEHDEPRIEQPNVTWAIAVLWRPDFGAMEEIVPDAANH